MRTPELALCVRPDRARVVVVVGGEIDLATIDELDAAVGELRAVGWRQVVVDLRDVEFVDSTALAWLLRTEQDARANDWTLSLVDGSPAVARLLELTGMRRYFRWASGL